MRSKIVCFFIVIFSILSQNYSVDGRAPLQERSYNTTRHEKLQIEDRTILDEMNALVRLPGDISRKDFVALGMDAIIVVQCLPLHWTILSILNAMYKVLKFIHPAYWFLFPSSKPANVVGRGFAKLLK